jgi:hypothetical protein
MDQAASMMTSKEGERLHKVQRSEGMWIVQALKANNEGRKGLNDI